MQLLITTTTVYANKVVQKNWAAIFYNHFFTKIIYFQISYICSTAVINISSNCDKNLFSFFWNHPVAEQTNGHHKCREMSS